MKLFCSRKEICLVLLFGVKMSSRQNTIFLPEHIKVSSLSCLVMDEADTLMDDSFRGLVKNILTFLQVL